MFVFALYVACGFLVWFAVGVVYSEPLNVDKVLQ